MSVGDRVWYKNPNKEKSKLSPYWNTKARVKEVYKNAYKLINANGKEFLANQRKVKARQF